MINKKLLALLAFTSHGMEANQDISSIDSQLQKQNSYKTLYVVLGSAAAVAIAGGAIWWFTKKDKKTTEGQQGQQPVEEREFNEQDIDDVLKLNTREEWLKLYEQKAKSHMKSAEKIAQEIEAIPANMDKKEKKVKYREIFKNNKFAKDIIILTGLFCRDGFEYIMAKECLNMYKKHFRNDEELKEIFNAFLLYVSSNIKLCISLQYSPDNVQEVALLPEVAEKIQIQRDNQKVNATYLKQEVKEYQILHPNNKIKLIKGVDPAALKLVVKYGYVNPLKDLFDIARIGDDVKEVHEVLQQTIQDNNVINEFQKYSSIINAAYRMVLS